MLLDSVLYKLMSAPVTHAMMAWGALICAVGIIIVVILIRMALSYINKTLESTKDYLKIINRQNIISHKNLIMLSSANEEEKKKALKKLDEIDFNLTREIESL